MRIQIIVILLVLVGVATGFAQLGEEHVKITVTSSRITMICNLMAYLLGDGGPPTPEISTHVPFRYFCNLLVMLL